MTGHGVELVLEQTRGLLVHNEATLVINCQQQTQQRVTTKETGE